VGFACRSVWSEGLAAKMVVTLATVVLVFVSRAPAVFVSREPAVPLGFVSPGSVAWVTRPTGLPRMPLRLGRILRG
jgi:hypothetical protein